MDTIVKTIKSFAVGVFFGIGSPIPGVSSGTLAILLNVYDSFFSTISWKMVKNNLYATVIFFLGWAFGLVATTLLLAFLFEDYGQIVNFVFIGLIAGSVPMIFRKASAGKVKIQNVAVCVLALAFMVFLAFFSGDLATHSTIEELGGITPAIFAWLFFASIVSAAAMLVPGVGGSMMMLSFGIYIIYLEAVSTFNMVFLAIMGSGMILGILAGMFFTQKMLLNYSQTLYFAILGFIVGSLLILYPGLSLDISSVVSVFMAGLSFVFAFWISKKE